MRLLVLFILISCSAVSQIGTGQWRLHVPSRKAIDVVALNDRVFTAFENGVLEYHKQSEELSVWDVVNGLSDISVSCLGEASGSVFIGYENGNIDQISGNTLTNIPAIKLANVQGSKKIYKMVEYNSYLYCATGFAIVKIDPIKSEVKDTYYPTNGNQAIIDVSFQGDTVFALTDNQLFKGNLSNVALADPNEWVVDNRVPVLSSSTESYEQLMSINNELYLSFIDSDFGLDSVFKINATGLETTFSESFATEVRSIENVDGKLAVNFFTSTIVYNPDYSYNEVISAYTFGEVKTNAFDYKDGTFWMADDENGLVRVINNSGINLSFSGPPKNTFFHMDWRSNKLVAVSGGVSDVISSFNNGGMYTFEDESWTLTDPSTDSYWPYTDIWDFLSVSINPANRDEIAVGSYSPIPLSLIDENGKVTDTLTANNSIIDNAAWGNGFGLISAVQYDNSGNLWMLNGGTNEPLKVFTKDDEWVQFDLGSAPKGQFSRKMVIDNNSNKWFAFRDIGIYGFSDNGTITTTSDDSYVQIDLGDGLPSNSVTAIAVDHDNEVWVGTDNGFAVIYNASGAFDNGANVTAQRIKLEFEGNVEYVLGTTHITDIEVDGGNRKWIATASSGIILLSEDGLEIIEQHTTDNSPLISNNIIDLKLNQSTGELFIVTDQGLVSYRTDASQGDPNYSNVKVFPNPVRPEFTGPVTIQGIKGDSDIKVTDSGGNLIYQTTSNGGTATWNAKTLSGQRVQTGVYLIWTAPNEGKGRRVGKVLVISE